MKTRQWAHWLTGAGIVIVTFTLASFRGTAVVAQDGPDSQAKSTARKLLEQHFSKLNKELDGRLSPFMEGLDGTAQVVRYLRYASGGDDSPEARRDYEAFQRLLRECLRRSNEGNGVEYGMLASPLMFLAGPEIVLDTIGPHIGKGGELHAELNNATGALSFVDGLTDRRRQLDFSPYLNYLRGRGRGTAKGENRELLIDHMMRTDPVAALDIMLQVEYGMNRTARGRVDWPHVDESVDDEQQKQRLQANVEGMQLYQVNVLIRAVRDLSRLHNKVPQDLVDRARQELAKCAREDEWWLRDYAAAVAGDVRVLKDPSLLTRLASDSNELVGATALRAKSKR